MRLTKPHPRHRLILLIAAAALLFFPSCSDEGSTTEPLADLGDSQSSSDLGSIGNQEITDSSGSSDEGSSDDIQSTKDDTKSVDDAAEESPDVFTPDDVLTEDQGTLGEDSTPELLPNSWCRYQWPMEKAAVPGESFPAFLRVFVEGVTDQSPATDPSDSLIVELGFGPDESLPSNNADWSWNGAAGEPTWDADALGESGNDEYTATLTAPGAGNYDLAGRISLDGGTNWVYCDGNGGFEHDGSEDGYQVEKSGYLIVSDPCDPNPCDTPPMNDCAPNGIELKSFTSPGSCTLEEGAASCSYTESLMNCSEQNQICAEGACVAQGDFDMPQGQGSVLITEIMAIADNGDAAEWIELSNPRDEAVSLVDCTISVEPGTTHEVTEFLHIPGKGAIVMASSADTDDNYGITWSYVYNGIDLPDAGATLTLKCEGEIIDEVTYDKNLSENISLQLGSSAYDAEENDDLANWCPGTTPYGTHDLLGTPGEPNLPCPVPVELDWCRLQWQDTEKIEVDQAFTAYLRLNQAGITDLSDGVDPNPLLLIDAGYGPDGSLPGESDEWLWTQAEGNPGWSAAAAGESNNDEYMATLSIPKAGLYDLAFRASADGGLSWTYCDGIGADGSDGSTNGYQPENAGALSVGALKILFVGNSYTSANDLTDLVEGLFLGGSYGGEYDSEDITQGGAQLYDHLQNTSLISNIENGDWTHVVVQEQSYVPVLYPEVFYLNAQAIAKIIKEAGSQVVFFETWARKEGNSLYSGDLAGYDPISMQAALKTAYSTAAENTSGIYAPVGDAWEIALNESPEISLHSADGSHPSKAGSYLAACVFYAIFTGESLSGNTFSPSGLSQEEIEALQGIATELLLP